MKIQRLSAALILASGLFMTSCNGIVSGPCVEGSGSIVTAELNIDKFDCIELNFSADISVKQGDKQKVVAKGHENIIELIRTSVSDACWSARFDSGCVGDHDLTIEVTVPRIEGLRINGSGDFIVEDFSQQSGELELDINGSGDIELGDFDGIHGLNATINGSGNIIGARRISTLENLDITISGSGDFEGLRMRGDHCEVSINGSGDCSVYPKKSLDASIQGSGDVLYKGNPKVEKQILGSGDVVRM